MKKKLISLVSILALLAVLWVPVLAAEPQLDYVTAAALLLTDEEWLELEERALASTGGNYARHDPDKLAEAILEIYRQRAVRIFHGARRYILEE